MPMKRSAYPKDWKRISLEIRQRDSWTCQHCQRPCRKPGEDVFLFSDRLGDWIKDFWEEISDDESGEFGYVPKPGRFTLTVAHLDHDPSNCEPGNLLSLCPKCHLKYDAQQHKENSARTRSSKRREKDRQSGQISLFE